MTHERVLDRLQAYLDGEVPADEHERIRAHLAACDACRAEHDALAGLWQQVDAVPTPEPEASTWPALADELARRRRRTANGWSIRGWSQRGLAAAALAAGILLGVGLSGTPEINDGSTDGAAGTVALGATDGDDYLQDGLPTLDELWLEAGTANEDTGS